MKMTNWNELLKQSYLPEYPSTIQGDIFTSFEQEYGSDDKPIFTAWSDNYVYFPVFYDGLPSVNWVPRNPSDKLGAVYAGI